MRSWQVWASTAAVGVLAILASGLEVWALSARAAASRQTLPPSSPPLPHLGYGINVRLEDNIDSLFAPLGLEWIKLWEEYEQSPPGERLPYQVLFLVDCGEGMPADLDQWGDEVEGIARAGLGFVEAYEIGNEPNVARFWGNHPPDPSEYVQVLRVAYERIKAVDPAAIVVSAGLAPVGRIEGMCMGGSGSNWSGNNCSAMDEQEYARQMLLLGAGDYFDAFGYHPYGFAYEPEVDPDTVSNGFAFRGAEVIHGLLEEHGLTHTPVWATEFNWLRDWTEDGRMPSHCLDEYEAAFGWMEVSEVQQANYITRAFQYADDHWPWMGAMFVWNLDWHNYHLWACEAARHFSVRRNNGTTLGAPTLAYDALGAMEKRPGYFGPRLAVEPSALDLLADVYEPGVITATVEPWNAGYRVLTWTATVATGMQVTPTLAVTTGLQGAPLTITVDSAGYLMGVYTGSITLAAVATDVLDSPQTVPVTLTVERFDPRLAVRPPTLNFLADVREPGVLTGAVTPINTGYHVLTWTASVAAGMMVSGTGTVGGQVTPTLAITTGLQGTPLVIMVDSSGYSTGTFIGLISVAAVPTNVLDSPQIVPVILRVAPQLHRVYLPIALRSMLGKVGSAGFPFRGSYNIMIGAETSSAGSRGETRRKVTS